MKTLTPAERLIVGADFKPTAPNGREWVRSKVLELADKLKGTGVCLKVNSALRACGYRLIDEIHERGLRVFADLKLIDISETLATDGVILREAKPELLTVICTAGSAAIAALKAELPDTEVLGVTVLTSLNDVDTDSMFRATVKESAVKFALVGESAGVDGFICSAKEVETIRAALNNPHKMTINTPAIRPSWSVVKGDDQNSDRAVTPERALEIGADRIVVARPIVRAENPYDATMRTIDEIERAIKNGALEDCEP